MRSASRRAWTRRSGDRRQLAAPRRHAWSGHVQEHRYGAYELPRECASSMPRRRVPHGAVPSHAARLRSPVARLLLRRRATCPGDRCRAGSNRRARSSPVAADATTMFRSASPARSSTGRSVRRHTQGARVGVSRSAAARCRAFRWRCGVDGEWRRARAAVPSCAAGRGDCCGPAAADRRHHVMAGQPRHGRPSVRCSRAVASLPVVQSSPGTIAFPSAEALRRLDALRAQLDTVGD